MRTDRFLESLPLARDRPWVGYIVALALTLVALAVRFALGPLIPPGFPFLTFFPAVIVSCFLYGRGPGIFAAILCGVLAWSFFITHDGGFGFARGTAVAMALYGGVVAIDIALIQWMQRANRRLLDERQRRQVLADRSELLFHELQHRVANNLQMIGAVLSLQRRTVTDPAARQAIGDAVAKLQTIGRLQRQLYSADNVHLTLDRFLPDLATELIDAAGQAGVTCAVEVEPDLQLPPNSAVPVALILAEAVANALEHGFADGASGAIQIRVVRVGDRLDMTIADDGAGLPAGFDPHAADSLGLRIARTLAEQLGGGFTLAANAPRGVVSRLSFPIATDPGD
jgi:two-component sensor histidine kinase